MKAFIRGFIHYLIEFIETIISILLIPVLLPYYGIKSFIESCVEYGKENWEDY